MVPDYSILLAVPFSRVEVCVPLPDKRPFPKELKTIGDHLKHARLKRNLLIKDVLVILGVSRWTLREWEHDNLEPFVCHYPKIISFLGYYPFDHETESLGGKIKKYRHVHGLSQKEFGKLVGVLGCTVSTWERNKLVPRFPAILSKIKELI